MKSRKKPMRFATPDSDPPSKRSTVLVGRIKVLANSPAARVGLLVIAIVGVVSGVRFIGAKQKFAQLRFVESSRSGDAMSPDTVEAMPPAGMFSGEAFDTTTRLREVSAFGLALSLTAFGEFAERRVIHATPETLLASLARRRLVPPGIEIGNGKAMSQLSRLRLHYQTSPLRFEVLSEPAPNVHGPTLLFRFPLPAANPGTITYFRSRSEKAFQVPHPFSSSEQIVSMGWTIEQWQGEILSLDETTLAALREQNEWLRSQK